MTKSKTKPAVDIGSLYDFTGEEDGAPEPAAMTPETGSKPRSLKHRPSNAKRNRDWERQNPPTCYRGIPAKLHAEIVEIANDLAVPPGDVARKLMEYGLAAYRAGNISFQPIIVGKRRLYVPEPEEKPEEKK